MFYMDNKEFESAHSILLNSSISPSANVEFIKAEIPAVSITLQKPINLKRKDKSFSYVEGDKAIVYASGKCDLVSKNEYEKVISTS